MDCGKLSANIAAATCRTGRIDVRELMLVNWDDWQKYQREFDGVPPLFKVTGLVNSERGVVTPSDPTKPDQTLPPYNFWGEQRFEFAKGDVIKIRRLDERQITSGLVCLGDVQSSWWFPVIFHLQGDEGIEWKEWTFGAECYGYMLSNASGYPLEYEIVRASTGNDLTLSLSDGITYPPVVSLLATHERGIVSFAEEVKGAYLNGYAHRIQFTAFDRNQDVKDVLNILGRGRFVALARYEQDGEDVVVVYGADCGMVAEAGSFDSSNTDGEIGQAVLATDEGCMESVPMLTLEPSGSLATVADAWEWLKEHSFG